MLDFTAVFKNAPIGMFVSVDNIISACNLEACRLFKYRSEELINQPISIIYKGFSTCPSLDQSAHLLENNALSTFPQSIIVRKSGQAFWCNVTNSILPNSNLHVKIWTFQIITPVPLENKELSQREKQLAASILLGKTSRNIANDAGISIRTVEYYRQRLMKKLDAKNHTDLILRLANFVPNQFPVS